MGEQLGLFGAAPPTESPIAAHGWAPAEGARPLTPEEVALLDDYESRADLSPAQRHVLEGYRFLLAEGFVVRDLNASDASSEQCGPGDKSTSSG